MKKATHRKTMGSKRSKDHTGYIGDKREILKMVPKLRKVKKPKT
ncbi:MAG: hypothetical protein ABID54_03310 [Pseudomonadota bacterium]